MSNYEHLQVRSDLDQQKNRPVCELQVRRFIHTSGGHWHGGTVGCNGVGSSPVAAMELEHNVAASNGH